MTAAHCSPGFEVVRACARVRRGEVRARGAVGSSSSRPIPGPARGAARGYVTAPPPHVHYPLVYWGGAGEGVCAWGRLPSGGREGKMAASQRPREPRTLPPHARLPAVGGAVTVIGLRALVCGSGRSCRVTRYLGA